MPGDRDVAALGRRLANEVRRRKAAEKALLDCEDRIRLAGQASGDALWDWNLLTGEVDRNHVSAALFGDNSPIENRSILWWHHHIHQNDRRRVSEIFKNAVRNGQSSVSAEYRLEKADGSFAYIYDRGCIIRDEDGVAFRAIGTVTDLTALKVAQDQLLKTEADLIHVSRQSAMGTMASIIAHELNQPLAAIANYIRAGRRMAATEGQNQPAKLDEALQAAEENALRAGQIVRRLRELVTRGHVDRRSESVRALIDDACTIALLDAERVGVKCTKTIGADAATVLGDRIQLQQVIINLVRNAVEAVDAHEASHIWITARRCDDLVEISIADDGLGMSESQKIALFSASDSLKASSMGIGLSICRTIVEAHGGKIWLASNDLGRTDFRFTLPSG